MVLSEKNCELVDGFSYVHPTDGKFEASFVLMKAPSVRNLKSVSKLKQAFTRAISEVQNKNKSNEPQTPKHSDDGESNNDDEQMDSESIIAILESSNEDMDQITVWFQQFMVSSQLFWVEGEAKVPMTEKLVQQLSIPDFYKLMGDYLLVFILASLLK